MTTPKHAPPKPMDNTQKSSTQKPNTQKYSIQKRLLTSLLIGLPTLWLVVMISITIEVWHEMNELTDTQITQLARYLVATSSEHETPLVVEKSLLSGDLGESEEDYMGFAIWNTDGKLLMTDGNGKHFEFLPNQHGFVEELSPIKALKGDWRLFYAHDGHGRVVAVGQNLQFRQEVIIESLMVQALPALLGLLVLTAWLWWAVRRAFLPLKTLSQTIAQRQPQDDSPISQSVPSEVAPLVNALNAWFIKVSQTLEQESRFASDASHELRSPLTALQLQADILQQEILTLDDDDRQDALLYRHEQIKNGIERSNHLVEQLLILAKLNPENGLNPSEVEPIDWKELSEQVLSEINLKARQKNQRLVRQMKDKPLSLVGNATLMAVLLRNLLDNAIRYCPTGSTITLNIDEHFISVFDNGKGVDPKDLARLSERFFRPAGQSELGSGLGLSIVKHIAQLHHLKLSFDNRYQTGQIVGFEVVISPDK